MKFWIPLLALIGFGEPEITPSQNEVVSPVEETAQVLEAMDRGHKPVVINIKYTPGKRCSIVSATQIIQRNLTLPYSQQTVYGTSQCQTDD